MAGMNDSERTQLRRRLLKMLKDSFVYSTEPIFTLASGRKSHFYIDCKKVTLDPEGAFLTGLLFLDRIDGLEADAIGGLTLGADPIVSVVAVLSFERGEPVPAFIVRKDPKPYGVQPFIEGNLTREARVAVVDDVLTGGRSTERTIRLIEETGCRVVKVIALIDRKEGGAERLEKLGFEVESLFTVEDLLKA
jgi:orotate phosphoribosyltransferase